MVPNICGEKESTRQTKEQDNEDKRRANGFPTGKGAPALESRTEGRLVSPTTAAEKKNCTPTRIWL